MTHFGFLNLRKNSVFKSLFILSLLLYASALSAQSRVDFSGTWILDNAKSDASFKDYKIVCTIEQTSDSIVIAQTFLMKNGEKVIAPAYSYGLDGKETSKESYGGIDKESAKWSPDKKALTITITRTVGTNVYGSSLTYKLSNDGHVLTIQTTDVNTSSGVPSVIQVFNKE
ncbi:MAG: hypothetical protein A2V64_11580 [Bacteroidetes bacterium RBG_13_43_22]|nr:MAG: hypothetical protein A2V64_11580 [Bacteroidetes bacterium RBG_13_43_22]